MSDRPYDYDYDDFYEGEEFIGCSHGAFVFLVLMLVGVAGVFIWRVFTT